MHYLIEQANRLGNRNSNQDRFAAIETDEGVLLVLADGMGGRPGGEVAAQTLIDTADEVYRHVPRPVAEPEALLQRILMQAHHFIIERSLERYDRPPGTTAVLCLLEDGNAHWAHVGDSRLYLFRKGLPIYRTTDHSYVEELYRRGLISTSERESHPRRNQITQCIGYQLAEPEVEQGKLSSLSSGDVLLLCSDGLWGALDDAQMGLMLDEADLEESLNRMAEQAEANSYPRSDNISVLALRLDDKASSSTPRRTTQAGHNAQGDKLLDAIANLENIYSQYRDELVDEPEEGDEEPPTPPKP